MDRKNFTGRRKRKILLKKMQTVREELSQSGASADLRAAAAILLYPLLKALPAGTNQLIIVPSQSLCSIPFGALPLPNGGSLIDKYVIAYLPSASSLQFLHFGRPSASDDLFLGALGDIAVEGRPALPGTLEETAAIQALYPHAKRVTGAGFNHDAMKQALLQYRTVHFATHGLFNEQTPLFSALVAAPSEHQPAHLSLYEVMDMKIKAQLVILSACETDRGKETGGDEITGLTRTFLQAGAEDVVSSLWKVSDESTALLMKSLHTHLRLHETAPVALRHAQLEVRKKFPQPADWAAFVNTGVR